MKVTNVDVDSLIPYPGNVKQHPQKQVELLLQSITEFGFNVPIFVTPDLQIIAGHGRLQAAMQMGLKKVPVVRVSGDSTEEQIRAYRLIDNRVAELSEWDVDALEEEFQSISDMDLQPFEFDKILPKFRVDPNKTVDDETEFLLVINCGDESTHQTRYEELLEREFDVRIME